jgi:hypothetical protein
LLVFALLAALAAIAGWRAWRRHRRRRALARLFDATVDAAGTPAAQLAAMSELLRRAARRRDPAADTLHGEAWVRFLDGGLKAPVFAAGAGMLLLEGGFRAAVATRDVATVRPLARRRFLDWMAAS